jgi:hypothetical protein
MCIIKKNKDIKFKNQNEKLSVKNTSQVFKVACLREINENS